MGLIAFAVATALRAQWNDRSEEVADTLSLLMVALEQAAQDRGSMTMASSLLLLPDPPMSMFERNAGTTAFRQFPRLSDQHWITAMIAHLEGLDQISSRREQLGGGNRRNPRSRRRQDDQDEGRGDPTPNAKAKAVPKRGA